MYWLNKVKGVGAPGIIYPKMKANNEIIETGKVQLSKPEHEPHQGIQQASMAINSYWVNLCKFHVSIITYKDKLCMILFTLFTITCIQTIFFINFNLKDVRCQ